MLSTNQWTHMLEAHPGFANMAAGAKYELLVQEFGIIRTLIPSWRGIALGTTTKMPFWSHLPSAETAVIGSAIVHKTYDHVMEPLWETYFPPSSPPTVKIEKEP